MNRTGLGTEDPRIGAARFKLDSMRESFAMVSPPASETRPLMNSLVSRLNGYAPLALSLLRAVTGLVFLQHGTQKLFALPPRAMPAPELLSLAGTASLLELIGGTLIILGLFTRPVAFLLSGQMAVGYFLVHAPKSPFPAVNGGDAAILFCFVFLYLVFAGPGPLSVDAARAGRRY